MVSVTNILMSGPWGPDPAAPGGPGRTGWKEPKHVGVLAKGLGSGRVAGEVQDCLHSWEGPKGLCLLLQHPYFAKYSDLN